MMVHPIGLDEINNFTWYDINLRILEEFNGTCFGIYFEFQANLECL